jgi:hypothetical protein
LRFIPHHFVDKTLLFDGEFIPETSLLNMFIRSHFRVEYIQAHRRLDTIVANQRVGVARREAEFLGGRDVLIEKHAFRDGIESSFSSLESKLIVSGNKFESR